MLQEILALTIVFIAIFYTVYQAVLFFIPSQQKTNTCSGMCSGCGISELKNKNITIDKKSINNKIKIYKQPSFL